MRAGETLFERVAAVVHYTGSIPLNPLPPIRDVKSQDDAESAVLEWAKRRGYYGRVVPIALVYRIAGTQDLRVKMWVDSEECSFYADEIPMPCSLCRTHSGDILLDCDATVFFTHYVKLTGDL